jgi:hypothetical protein
MEDQYPPLPQGSCNLLVQVEDDPVHPMALSEAHNHWGQYLPNSPWWRYLAHIYSQVRLEHTEV